METILETSGGSRDAKWIFVLSTSRNLYVDQKLCRWLLWLLVAIYMEFIFFARCEGGRGRSSSGEATCLLIPTREQLRRLRPARRSSGHSSGEQQWLWTNGCGRMVVNNGCGRMVVNNDCKIWL